MDDKLRMEAYYYSFNSTNCRVIDEILSAVACAGKAYHNTSEWDEPINWKDDEGPSYADSIQSAADRAANHIRKLTLDK